MYRAEAGVYGRIGVLTGYLAERVKNLPATKEQQNRRIGEGFFGYFPKETAERMKRILEKDTYIPQEILNIMDF